MIYDIYKPFDIKNVDGKQTLYGKDIYVYEEDFVLSFNSSPFITMSIEIECLEDTLEVNVLQYKDKLVVEHIANNMWKHLHVAGICAGHWATPLFVKKTFVSEDNRGFTELVDNYDYALETVEMDTEMYYKLTYQ